MRRLGQLLMALGGVVGVFDAMAMAGQFGFSGVPWLVNVALAKLGLIAAGGLMAGGAVSVRLARRREHRELEARTQREELP
jgi:hypothetical protein